MLIGEIVQYCSNPALGRFLAILKRLFVVLEIIVPIVLMVSIAFILLKLMTNTDVVEKKRVYPNVIFDYSDSELRKQILNACTAAVIVMLLPAIVNVVMYAISQATNDKFVVSECWNNAYLYEGKADYIPKKAAHDLESFIIDPSKYIGIEGDPNYRSDRLPDDDDSDFEEGLDSTSFGNIVWDPNDVTKTSNLTSAQLTSILNSHGGGKGGAKNFVPYSQALISAEQKYHVNALFLVAVNAWESGWMKSPISKACNNLGGVTESASHPSNGCGSNPGHKFAYFNSVGEYIDYHANLLHSSYLTEGGAYYNGKAVSDVQKKYCPLSDSGCERWASGVTSIGNSLFKQVQQLNISGSNIADRIATAAEYYAWPLGTPKSKYCRFNGGGGTPQFKKDYRAYWPEFAKKSDKSVAAGTCCCHFARTCVVKGIGKKFKFTLLPNAGKDEYTKQRMAEYGFTRIKFDGKKSSLRRGDVLYYRKKSGGGHVWIYLGDGKAAEGAHNSGYGGRITKVGSGKFKLSDKTVYYIFRHY